MRISDWSSDVCSSDLASRIIEPQHRASVRLRPDIECGRLAPFHIGHISRQKNQSGSMPRTVTISEAKPVRASELEWFSHDRRTEERRVGKEGVSTCRYRWSANP